MDINETNTPQNYEEETSQEVIGDSSNASTSIQQNEKEQGEDEVEFIEEVTRVVAISSKEQTSTYNQLGLKKPKSITNKHLRVKNSETEESGEERGGGSFTRLQKELNRLHFVNPGEKLHYTEISQGRRLRRRAERTSNEKSRPQHRRPEHDRDGKLIKVDGSTVDLCDCLDPICKGCFWPCKSCESRLCGSICRVKRKGAVAYIEVPGMKNDIIARNPFLDEFNEN
uniref:ARF7 effector protein C-terminal domain-containing protein n=1 Tax=Acrobeloides nanus TaxID=290746 RepID=A0A914E7Y7_9BILA